MLTTRFGFDPDPEVHLIVLVARLGFLQRLVIVALLKQKAGLRIAFFQGGPLMIFAARKTKQSQRQSDPS
jgi:hypothetical protein